MNARSLRAIAWLVAFLLVDFACRSWSQATFTGLGDLPGGGNESLGNRVSGDGLSVSGMSLVTPSTYQPFRWRQAGGMIDLGNIGLLGGEAWGIAYDGDTIAGVGRNLYGYPEAFRWVDGGGMSALGDFEAGPVHWSYGLGSSSDGSKIGGQAFFYLFPPYGSFEASIWSFPGGFISGLGFLGTGLESGVNDLCGSGLAAVGYGFVDSLWTAFHPFRWQGVMTDLGVLTGGTNASAFGVSTDGATVVGWSESSSHPIQAFRWTSSTGMVGLGALPGHTSSVAYDASADGSIVVGSSGLIISNQYQPQRAFIWDSSHGMRDLQTVLTNDYGLAGPLTGWTLLQAQGVSDDGRSICGYGISPLGDFNAWLCVLPNPAPLPADLNGSYLAGSRDGVSPGLTYATTVPGLPAGRVLEQSGAANAREATYTPFSDAIKLPTELVGLDLRGVGFQCDIELVQLNLFSSGLPAYSSASTQGDYFQVGLGREVRSDDANPEVWVVTFLNQSTGTVSVMLQTKAGVSGPSYDALPGETKFHVSLDVDPSGSSATATVTPLNGPLPGTQNAIGSLPLDLANDNVSSAGFYAGFISFSDKSRAQAILSNLTTSAPKNWLYAFCDDPYVKVAEAPQYRVGMANLAQPVRGFQAFFSDSNPGVQSFVGGSYTTYPFGVHIIDPITGALNLAAGIAAGDPPLLLDARLADIGFVGTNEGVTGMDFRSNNPPTRFSDSNGDEVVPQMSDSPRVVVDSTPPGFIGLTATQSHGNVLNGAQPTIQGDLLICVDAKDVGPLVNGSGLASQPTISIDFPGTGDVLNEKMYAGPGNVFCFEYDINGDNGCGIANFTIQCQDDAGNLAATVGFLTLNTVQVIVDVDLDGSFTGTSFTREIQFWIESDTLPGPVWKNLNFVNGQAHNVVLTALDGLVCASYGDEIAAKDPVHTLTRNTALLNTGPNLYRAYFTGSGPSGDALLSGDCWGTIGGGGPDDLVDILDFGKFAQLFGSALGSKNTPHPATPPHPDFNGVHPNGFVESGDYTFISINFLKVGEPVPGIPSPQPRPKATCTVEEMQDAGIVTAPLYDLNRDGWITFQEIADWLSRGGKGFIKQ